MRGGKQSEKPAKPAWRFTQDTQRRRAVKANGDGGANPLYSTIKKGYTLVANLIAHESISHSRHDYDCLNRHFYLVHTTDQARQQEIEDRPSLRPGWDTHVRVEQ